jgi:hypothetical protein
MSNDPLRYTDEKCANCDGPVLCDSRDCRCGECGKLVRTLPLVPMVNASAFEELARRWHWVHANRGDGLAFEDCSVATCILHRHTLANATFVAQPAPQEIP